MIGRLHPKLPKFDSLVRRWGSPCLSYFPLRLCGEAWLWTFCLASRQVNDTKRWQGLAVAVAKKTMMVLSLQAGSWFNSMS